MKFKITKSMGEARRDRPVYIMFDHNVPEFHRNAVQWGVNIILSEAKVNNLLEVYNFGSWRSPNWYSSAGLSKWNSIDWYMEEAKKLSNRSKQIDGEQLLYLLMQEPWQENKRHYDVLVTSQDIFAGNTNFCIGLATHGFGTVISTNRFTTLPNDTAYECIVTETIHEMGHVFGLVSDSRTNNIELSLGRHCTNTCTMRQGLSVPHDWLKITEDRLRVGTFCDECKQDLFKYFKN